MNSTFFATLLRHLTALVTRLKLGITLLFAMTLTLLSTPSLAQSGTLDTSYGPYIALAYGRFLPTADHFFKLHDAIVLPDDRVVASGACTAVAGGAATPGNRFCLAVWSPDGRSVTLYVHSSPVNRVSTIGGGALAAQPDGKIVVTGSCRYSNLPGVGGFCTVRFNANFTSDTGFAVGLQNTAPSPTTTADSYANAIAIQPDGKIVVAGQCGLSPPTIFCAARLLPDGNPDATFGGTDSLRTFLGVNSATPFDRVKRIALAPNGQIYLGGDCAQSSIVYTRACVARLNADGSIDAPLSNNTVKPLILEAIGNGVSSDSIFDMVVQANGEFIFAGTCRNPSSSVLVPCAQRLAAPDATQFFAGTNYSGASTPSGSYTLREPATAGAFSILRVYLQPDGKMLALLKDESSNTSYRVRRYNEDGSIDANWAQPAFDFNAATDNASGFANGLALAQQRSGKVIAMGYTKSLSTDNPQARVIRLDNRRNPGRNCSSDIDGDGKVLSTTDGLLLARVAAGMTGNAAISGAIGAGATRNTWPLIRDYLITQCGMVVAP